MKNLRKSSVLILLVLFSIIYSSVITGAFDTIYLKTDKKNLSKGLTLENITRFTTDGWINSHILRIDLTNPDLDMKVLTNQESIRKLESLSTLAKNNQAIAAVNGSFFSWLKESGAASTVGVVVKNGSMSTAVSEWNQPTDKMANLSILNNRLTDIGYLQFQGNITAPTGVTKPITRYNKVFNGSTTDLTLQDRQWSLTSENGYLQYPGYVEVIVTADIVSEVRVNMPATEIPLNGYVIIGQGDAGKFLTDNFFVGGPVAKSFSLNTDVSLIKDSLSGGTQLVKNGLVVDKFTFSDNGRYARTAIGLSADNQQVAVVTVDGNQKASIGLTLGELATYMKELGVYNAICFDGGGSSTMVARLPGNETVSLVNKPSDGSQRRIINGIGVNNTAPVGTLSGLIVSVDQENVFINGTRKVSVKGHDLNYNAVPLDPTMIKWSLKGLKGSYKDGTYTFTATGTGKIVATVGKISATADISVLSAPVSLSLSTKNIQLNPGENKKITVTGYNKLGYGCTILPDDLKWTFGGLAGKRTEEGVSFSQSGEGYVEVSLGKVKSYVFALVSSEMVTMKEGFEEETAVFASSPETVAGLYSSSEDSFTEGARSGKIIYDFTQDFSVKREAGIVFANNGLVLPLGSEKLRVDLKSTAPSSGVLKADFIDANGLVATKNLVDNFEDDEWIRAEVNISALAKPARLSRIYLVVENQIPEYGVIYLDRLVVSAMQKTVTTNKFAALKDTLYADPDYKKVTVKPSTTSFNMSIIPVMQNKLTSKEQASLKKVYTSIAKESEVGAFPGGVILDKNKKPSIKLKTLMDGVGNEVFTYKNTLFIQLNIHDKNSIRLTDKNWWTVMLAKIGAYKGKNIFIVSDMQPYGFSEGQEGRFFRDTLTNLAKKGMKVYYIYPGKENKSSIDRGVHFISVEGIGEKNISRLKIAVNKGIPTYSIISVAK